MILPFLTSNSPSHIALFMSGSGTNARNLLLHWKKEKKKSQVILVTDRPETSNARAISEEYHLTLIENDIVAFYQKHGCSRVSLAIDRGSEIRESWTNTLREQLRYYKIDFGIFAGFIPLTNITKDFPCLNVHPGDLTYEKNGQRYLIGLHTIPIEKAILSGLSYVRSSVILAEEYGQDQHGMDQGPILGISAKIPLDLGGYTVDQLQHIAQRREQRPLGGFRDPLENIAKKNQECLKQQGDWVVFPQVIDLFSQGRYGYNEDGTLYYRENNTWISIKTIVFQKNTKQIIPN